MKTSAGTLCSSGLKESCSERFGSFRTDPDVPMSVRRGLDDLFSKVAIVDSKLSSCLDELFSKVASVDSKLLNTSSGLDDLSNKVAIVDSKFLNASSTDGPTADYCKPADSISKNMVRDTFEASASGGNPSDAFLRKPANKKSEQSGGQNVFQVCIVAMNIFLVMICRKIHFH